MTLANRLKTHLSNIISQEQYAFVKDRSIHENIRIVQELAHSIHNSKARNLIILIKIDLKKAFDIVKRGAIKLAMEILNFLKTFINWIEAYICSPTYTCNINGAATSIFDGNRGIL